MLLLSFVSKGQTVMASGTPKRCILNTYWTNLSPLSRISTVDGGYFDRFWKDFLFYFFLVII